MKILFATDGAKQSDAAIEMIAKFALKDGDESLRRCSVWGADYPHNHVTWPNARAAADRLFAELPDDVRSDVLWNNAAGFFRIAAAQGASA